MTKNTFVNRSKLLDNFTTLPNQLLRDERLSWKARGLLVYMLSMPTDWKFYDTELAERSDLDGITVVRSAMKELKELGYIKKVAIRDERNKIKEWITEVYDIPIKEDFHNTENLESRNSRIKDSQNLENDTLLNTNNTKNLNILNKDINTLCTKEQEEADKKKLDKLEKERQAKQIIELYKSLPNLPKVSIVTKQRLKTVIARINNKDIGFDRLKIALKKYNESDYLKGELEKGVNWYNFDFIFKEDKLARVLDGGYQNNKPKQQYQKPKTHTNQQYMYSNEMKDDGLPF